MFLGFKYTFSDDSVVTKYFVVTKVEVSVSFRAVPLSGTKSKPVVSVWEHRTLSILVVSGDNLIYPVDITDPNDVLGNLYYITEKGQLTSVGTISRTPPATYSKDSSRDILRSDTDWYIKKVKKIFDKYSETYITFVILSCGWDREVYLGDFTVDNIFIQHAVFGTG